MVVQHVLIYHPCNRIEALGVSSEASKLDMLRTTINLFLAIAQWTAVIYFVFGVLSIAVFLLAAVVGEYTGWYRVEDYMCTVGPSCR